MFILSASTLASLLLFPAPQSSYDYIPGAVLKAGWPEGETANVEELVAVRFVNDAELDFAARIGDEVFLVHRPARFQRYTSMGTGVAAIAAVPLDADTDGVVAVSATGLDLKSWDLSGDTWENTPIPNSQGWANVDRLWVGEESFGSRVYGHDPVAAKLLAMDWNGSTWTSAPSRNLPGVLRDMVFVDYDPARTGLERAWLFPANLVVTDAAGSDTLLLNAAGGTDLIGAMRGEAPGEELLVWANTGPGGQTTLHAFNAMGAAPLYSLGSGTFTNLTVFDADVDQRDEVVLSRSGDASAVILTRKASLPTKPFWPLDLGDTVDTLEAEFVGTEPGIRTMAVGDFDRDGDPDLLVAHEGTNHLRFWINVLSIWEEQMRVRNEEAPVVQSGSSTKTVTFQMEYNEQVPSNQFRVQVWLQPDFTSSENLIRLENDLETGNGTSVTYTFTYDTTGLVPTHVTWLCFAALDANGDPYPWRIIHRSDSAEVEDLMAASQYPTVDHTEGWPWDDDDGTTGFRACARVAACNP